jgi:hypothetical protein
MSRTAVALFALAMLIGMSRNAADAAEPESAKRRNPDVLKPVEARTAVLREQVDTYLFNRDFTKITILEKLKDQKGDAVRRIEFAAKMVPVEEALTAHLAHQPRPIRMAVIEGSFPYKRQVEEFRKKLHLPSAAAVLKENNGQGNAKRANFRFLGVNVRRRTLDALGRPLEEYRALDLDAAYMQWLRYSGLPCEPETEELSEIAFPGLVMSRLRLFRLNLNPFESGDPPPAIQLPLLRKTIQAKADQPAALPNYCLLRVIDVTVESSRSYQYRLQVRMANPNFGRKDVAEPEMARKQELLSDWYEVPGKIVVDDEFIPYVVDQKDFKEKNGSPYKGINAMASLDREREVAFQLHRWVDSAPLYKDDEPVPIGDWAIADRVIVARGEYVSRAVKVDLPVWKYTMDSFFLPAENPRRPEKTGFEIYFGHNRTDETDTILVDFEGGHQVYTDPVRTVGIEDASSTEVLLLSQDGRLRARNSARDANSKERRARRESLRGRIEALKTR